jgi:hypothetical protein
LEIVENQKENMLGRKKLAESTRGEHQGKLRRGARGTWLYLLEGWETLEERD